MRRIALAVYRGIARLLLPRAFREEYGAELEDAVAARLSASGPIGSVITLISETLDVVRTGVRERWRGREHGPRTGEPMIEGVADLRTGAKNLLRRPGLALGATLIIALGIGATTTIYSVVDGVVLRPLPYDDPGSLVSVGAMAPG